MGCGCGNQQVSSAIGREEFEATPASPGAEPRVFASRGEAELYVARNGGGHVRPLVTANA